MNKSKITLYFIFIAFFTFLAIFLTIVQASYNNLTNPVKQVESDKYLEPLNPVLDSEIIQEIEKRQIPNNDQPLMINSLNSDVTNDSKESNIDVSPTTTLHSDTQPPLSKENNN